eukprot:38702-Rhodomonas_salina.1
MAKARQNPKIWTTTYRLDADAPAPYYDPTSFDIVPIGVQPIQQRKRAAVAVISNCGAKPRKRVIEKLRKHITVDWFGKCEQRAWPTDGSGKKLRKIDLLQQYAVYLVAPAPTYTTLNTIYTTLTTILQGGPHTTVRIRRCVG